MFSSVEGTVRAFSMGGIRLSRRNMTTKWFLTKRDLLKVKMFSSEMLLFQQHFNQHTVNMQLICTYVHAGYLHLLTSAVAHAGVGSSFVCQPVAAACIFPVLPTAASVAVMPGHDL